MENIFASAYQSLHYIVPFLIVLSIVVFVHEFGHFWVARRCGVKIETFSIGFGKEIFGWVDKKGTRWRVAWMPLGGYVKMFGDADPSSFGPSDQVKQMTEEEKKQAFYTQSLPKRFSIVAAGPAANYLFAIVMMALLFMLNGQPYTATTVATVIENTAAQRGGILAGDKVLSIDGQPMESFEDIKRVISLNAGTTIAIEIDRGGAKMVLNITPDVVRKTDRLGGEHTSGQLGISSTESAFREVSPVQAITESLSETWNITETTLKGLGQMIMGVRSADEIGGPLRIAEMSGKVAQDGVYALLWFVIVISINLGLINLFPIPLLDGGHLLFYIIEGLRGRPLSDRAQEYGARFGAAVVLALMLFATWNDLVHLRVFSFLQGLFS